MHVCRWSAWNQSRQGLSPVPPLLSRLGCSVGGDRVGFGQVCCAISSQQLLCCHLFACEFCLLGALWILGGFFSSHYIHFPILVSFHPLPLSEPGKGGRCGEAGVTCWFTSRKSPVLGLSWVLPLWGYKQHLSVLLLLMILAVSRYHCFSLCSVLLVLSHTPAFIHSALSANTSVFLSQPLHLYSAHKSQTMNVITGDTATQW